jgi:hypothetical protein
MRVLPMTMVLPGLVMTSLVAEVPLDLAVAARRLLRLMVPIPGMALGNPILGLPRARTPRTQHGK